MASERETIKQLPMAQLMAVIELQLREKGCASLLITGISMRPMLWQGRDRVLLAPPDRYGKGDVILYQRANGQYVLHRIVKKREGVCICSGDNQWEPEQVPDSRVLAVVTDFYHGEKRISIKHKGYRLYVWLWTVLMPVRKPILLICRWLYRLFRRKK